MLKKRLLFLGFFILLLSMIGGILIFDITSQPVTQISAPEAFSKEYAYHNPVVLLSYADGDNVYFKNQNALNLSTLNRGIDHLHTYRRCHMDKDFYVQHQPILTQKRGAGYWLWKPYFILKTMDMYPDNAIIMYADSGVIFSKDIELLLKDLSSHDRILVSQGKSAPLKRHLKREAQEKLAITENSPVLKGENIWGFFLVLKNTKENRDFIEKWLTLCCDGDLLTDHPFDQARQANAFEYHQHDQSLLSVVLAQQNQVFRSKTKIIPKNILRNSYGLHNVHRHPEQEWTSPWFIIGGMPSWLNGIILNNPIMQSLRKIREF